MKYQTIYIMKPLKYASKEGLAAYGFEGLFKVSSVAIITATPDSTSKRRQEKKKSPSGQKGFGEILADKAEQQQAESNLEGKTLGYARNGQSFVGQAMQREYK